MRDLQGKARELGGGFRVARVLPQAGARTVGPFVFFDYFGPVDFAPGTGIDVRPHPHIGLATITYLFEGSQVHRDTLGSVQEIVPGDVNWMTAGRGIAHSERSGPDVRARGGRMHGIQSWVGLPTAHEEDPPSFQHVAKAHLPVHVVDGATIRIVTGKAYGLESPVRVPMPIFYADAQLEAGATVRLPEEYAERGAMVVGGTVEAGGASHGDGAMMVFDASDRAVITATSDARVMLLGGAPLERQRHGHRVEPELAHPPQLARNPRGLAAQHGIDQRHEAIFLGARADRIERGGISVARGFRRGIEIERELGDLAPCDPGIEPGGAGDPLGQRAVDPHPGGIGHAAHRLRDRLQVGRPERHDQRVGAVGQQLGGLRLVGRVAGEDDHRAGLAMTVEQVGNRLGHLVAAGPHHDVPRAPEQRTGARLVAQPHRVAPQVGPGELDPLARILEQADDPRRAVLDPGLVLPA